MRACGFAHEHVKSSVHVPGLLLLRWDSVHRPPAREASSDADEVVSGDLEKMEVFASGHRLPLSDDAPRRLRRIDLVWPNFSPF